MKQLQKKTSTKKHQILIIDDHPVFRFGLSKLINQQTNLNVCGEIDDVYDAIRSIERLNPDIIIADISLKNSSGIELIHNIKLRYKKLPILVVSMHEEKFYAERVLKLGASGYIMKHETSESVIKAINDVLRGKIYVSKSIEEHILHKLVYGTNESIDIPVNTLTCRELEIFQLIGMGYSTRKISSVLNLSINTINTYRNRIKNKLNLQEASELFQHAISWFKR